MINISKCSFAYANNKEVLSQLDTSLQSGRVYGLLGKNGVGKSTLLKLLSGYIFPTEGSITALGSEPKRREPAYMRDVFFVTEEIEALTIPMRQYAKHTSLFYPNFSMEQLESFLNEFEVDIDAKMNTLSQGQLKKAIVSFGLACNTKIVLMDEPTNGMDIPSKGQFRKIVSNVATDDRCIIISTHQVRDLDSMIDSLLIIKENKLLLNTTIEDISKRLKFAPIGNIANPIHQELSARGDWGVEINESGIESRVDIEMLFNMAINNPQIIAEMFTK